MRLVLVTLVAWLVALSPARAQQQDQTARDAQAHQLFETASADFDSGRYDQALRLFNDAYALSSRPALLYNIGLCHDRLRHDHDALDAFQRFLAAEPDAPERASVEARVRALQDALAHATAPETAARTQIVVVHDAAPPPPPPRPVNVLEEWWFWTLIGVAVVGGAVAIALAVVLPGHTEDPITPTGGLFTALSAP